MSWEHGNFWPAACCVALLTHLASSIMETYSPHKPYQKVAWPWQLISLVFAKNSATSITTNTQILGEGVPQLNGVFCEKKNWHLYTCFIIPRQFLDQKGANSWSLFAYETKSEGKQDFTKPKPFRFKHHRVKSIAKHKAVSGRNPGDWQLWKLWYPQPRDRCSRRAGTLETVENCTTEFHRKKSDFPIIEELFSKFQWEKRKPIVFWGTFFDRYIFLAVLKKVPFTVPVF